MRTRSQKIFLRALKKIPGGVNSPVRAWKAVGGVPLVLARGHGSYVFDTNGKRYIDFVASWGPLILGHASPKIVHVLNRAAKNGTTFGAPIEAEVELAERVSKLMPAVEKLRLVNSGTEAAMSAIRLARAFTRRNIIIKFDGCYHGHSDSLLVKAGSGLATLSLPDSSGVPPAFARETLVAKFNDLDSVESMFARHGKNIAAVIVEPICGNMGVILPKPKFLNDLQQIANKNGALLIFDEVITGFRVSIGGAQKLFKIKPDLTCLGKILGGGLPLAAFGGRSEIMNLLAPIGPVYQAGTLSGNPMAVAAGLETLKQLTKAGVYERLEAKAKKLADGLASVVARRSMSATINRMGSMMTLFFGVDQVSQADDARRCDRQRFARFFHAMLQRGVYLPPAPFEAMFISLAHSTADLNHTIAVFDEWSASEIVG